MLNGHAHQGQSSAPPSPGLDEQQQAILDEIMADPALVDQIVRNEVVKATRKKKPKSKKRREPKPSPAPLTKERTFCPMIPPAAILAPEIVGQPFRVLCWMLMHSRGNKVCDASQQKMANELRVSLDTIQRAINVVEDQGFVKTERDARGNRDIYHLLVRAPGKAKKPSE